jgi:hypothetical protein
MEKLVDKGAEKSILMHYKRLQPIKITEYSPGRAPLQITDHLPRRAQLQIAL